MKSWVKCLLLLATVCLYVFLGGIAFVKMEKFQASRAHLQLSLSIETFVSNNSDCGVTDEDVRSLLGEVEVASQAGVFWANSHPMNGIKDVWKLTNAFFFAFEVVTSIGQGIIVPRTFHGRLFCMFFALFGVPICYLMLSVVGDTFYFMWTRLGKIFSPIRHRSIRMAIGIPITIFVLFVVLVTFPAFIVSWMEDLDIYSSLYFSFMILSTVGLGDRLVNSRNETVNLDWMRTTFVILYDLICLSVISVIFKGVCRYMERVREKKEQKVREGNSMVDGENEEAPGEDNGEEKGNSKGVESSCSGENRECGSCL